MKNKNDKRDEDLADFYNKIVKMLDKAAIMRTITVKTSRATPAAGCYGSAKALILAEVARNGVHPITKHLSSNLETA